MGGHRVESRRKPSLNWGLLAMLVLCVEVWIGIASVVAHHM
jgi:hypothetical protein